MLAEQRRGWGRAKEATRPAGHGVSAVNPPNMPSTGATDDHDERRRLLRPVRLRDRHRSLPDLEATPGREPPLLQRALRLLRGQPLRRRRSLLHGLGNLHFEQGHPARNHQEQHGDPSRVHHLRGPPDAPHPSPPPVAGLHAAQHQRSRTEDPAILCPQPRSPGGHGRVRLRGRSRGPDAHAHHRHAARYSRVRLGRCPRPHQRRPAPHRGGHARHGRQVRRRHDVQRRVRGIHRVAGVNTPPTT